MLDVDRAQDLPTIDLIATDSKPYGRGSFGRDFDRRTFEERYAELGFGLGTVPRRQGRDDAWWATPAGMLIAVSGALALLGLMIAS